MHQYDPVIVDGKLARLSVSQLQRFLDCEKKWYYKYIGGIDEPDQPWFKVGKDEHKKLENYYGGRPLEPGHAVAALPLLPSPSEDVIPEDQLQLLDLAGIPFQGSMDLIQGNDIYDYKFQSRIQKFPEPTPQAWGYLEELRRRNSGRESLRRYRFHYILVSKKGANPQKQTFEFTAEEIQQKWNSYAPTVERMKGVADGSIKPAHDSNACYKYGPCPYLGICDRGAMSFLDDLNKAKGELPAVELPEVDAKAKSSIRPPEVREGKLEALKELTRLTEEAGGYDNELVRDAKPKRSKKFETEPAAPFKIQQVEVRHQITYDVKRDGVFSATIGIGFTADLNGQDETEVRKILSDKILDAIRNEATEKGYKK